MNPNEIRKLKEKAPFPIFILVLLMFLPSFILQPQEEELNEKVAAYDALLKSSRVARARRTSFTAGQNRLQQLKAVCKNIDSQLPEASELPQIIDSINAVAKQNSVLVKDVSYAFSEKMGRLSVPCYSIVMNFDSYYEDMRRFVVELENLPMPLLVEEIFVSSGRNYRVTLKQLVK